MFKNVRALIVEDNTSDGLVLQRLLEGLGVSAELVTESNTVEEIHRRGRVDLVFLDFDLPGIDGFEILKVLLRDPDFQNVPIVAYTSHLSEMAAANEAGFHSFIGKPLSSTRLADQLQRILSGESVWEVR
jgi:two-component system, sensor histidine kinase SagS